MHHFSYTSINASSSSVSKYKPLALAITLAISTLAIESTHAATFTVTDAADSGANTLRQAVLDANASAGADIILFDTAAMGTSTITLTGTQLDNNEAALTITGPIAGDASSITINGGGNSRIIRSNQDLTLENLTLTGGVGGGSGSDGGAVRLESGVTAVVNDSSITGNTAQSDGGGISGYSGSLTINRSTISNNSTSGTGADSGGGIYFGGSLIITDSTISGNSTTSNGSNGGGIVTYGSLTLTQSTVSGNSTSANGGNGGGIYAGNATITQSTITGNSTVTGTGGGIQTNGLTLVNTILADNTGPNDNASVTGTINATNSLFGDPVAEINGTNTANVLSNAPALGPLQDNGGPTETMLPLAGSPALDVGDNASAPGATDQRGTGFARIFNTTVDIGAAELQNAANVAPVPIFSLAGLLAMLSGFLAIGWRQRLFKTK